MSPIVVYLRAPFHHPSKQLFEAARRHNVPSLRGWTPIPGNYCGASHALVRDTAIVPCRWYVRGTATQLTDPIFTQEWITSASGKPERIPGADQD